MDDVQQGVESKPTSSDTPFSVYARQGECASSILLSLLTTLRSIPAAQEPRGHASSSTLRNVSSPERHQLSSVDLHRALVSNDTLQSIELNANVDIRMPPKHENTWGLAPNARPRVCASAALHSALGWAKRSTKASMDLIPAYWAYYL